jgi:hypothetical protein
MSKVEIKLSKVIELLDGGKSRGEIATHFDLKMAQINQLFKHPKLKGLRAKKIIEPAFVLEDDLLDEVSPVVDETANVNSEEVVESMYGDPGFNPSSVIETINEEVQTEELVESNPVTNW